MSIELSEGWWLTTHGGVELLRWSNEAEGYVTDDRLGGFSSSGRGLGNRLGTTLARRLERPTCIVECDKGKFNAFVHLPDAAGLTHGMREAWAMEVLRNGMELYRQEQEQC